MSTPIETIVSHVEPASLPGPWSRLPAHESFVRLRGAETLRAELLATYQPAELLAQGVIHPGADRRLNPILQNDPELLFVGRPSSQATPNVVIGSGVCLGAIQPAWRGMLADPAAALLFQADQNVCLTYSDADTAILWSVGILAIRAPLPEALGPAFVEAALALLWPANERCVEPTLTVVDWSIADVSLPVNPQAVELCKHLQILTKYDRRVECSRWRPDPDQIDEIQGRLRHASVKSIIEWLEQDVCFDSMGGVGLVEKEPESISSAEPQRPPQRKSAATGKTKTNRLAQNYQETIRALIDAPTRGSKLAAARAKLKDFIERELVLPVIRSAGQLADPAAAMNRFIAGQAAGVLAREFAELTSAQQQNPTGDALVEFQKQITMAIQNAERVQRLLQPPKARRATVGWNKIG